MAHGTPEFEGFQENDIQVSKLHARLWKIEEENVKIREEIRGLVAVVRGWKGEKGGGFSDYDRRHRRAEGD